MFSGEEKDLDHIQRVRAHIRSHLKAMLGFEDTSGVEVHALVRALARLCESVESQRPGSPELSGPRWGLLLRLLVAERHGHQEDLTPTSLSHFEGVSKNTISSLLRGLEEQGYVQRSLDPDDYRSFRIQLTPAGRQIVESSAPERFAYVNRLASGLSGDEREQLITLLEKLYNSILANSSDSSARCPEA